MVLETAEFFADQSDAAYWAFVETWAAGTEPRDEAMKDEDPDAFFARCASRVRDVAAKVAGPDFRHGVLELSLGIRRYSPRLEMFRAVAREHAESISGEEPEADEASSRDGPACCLARAGNAFASDLATLRRMLADLERDFPESGAYSVPRVSSLDHAYPAPAPRARPGRRGRRRLVGRRDRKRRGHELGGAPGAAGGDAVRVARFGLLRELPRCAPRRRRARCRAVRAPPRASGCRVRAAGRRVRRARRSGGGLARFPGRASGDSRGFRFRSRRRPPRRGRD